MTLLYFWEIDKLLHNILSFFTLLSVLYALPMQVILPIKSDVIDMRIL